MGSYIEKIIDLPLDYDTEIYCVFYNDVIDVLSRSAGVELLAIYSHLASLSVYAEINPKCLAAHFSLSVTKINRILSDLFYMGFLTKENERIQGRFCYPEYIFHLRSVLFDVKEIPQKISDLKQERKRKQLTFTNIRRKEFAKIRKIMLQLIINRDEKICSYCHSVDELQIDHKIPLSKGGSDELENLQLLCRSCNSRKGDRQ